MERNEGFTDQATIAADLLRHKGYRVDLWVTHTSQSAEARDDIAKDFQISDRTFLSGRSGLVVNPDRKDQALEIQSAISSLTIFKTLSITSLELKPDKIFLSGSNGKPDFDTRNIILIYLLSN